MSLSLRAYMSLNWNLQVCMSLSLRQVYMNLNLQVDMSLSFDHMNNTLIGHYYRVENWIAGYHGMSRGRCQRHNKTRHHFCLRFYNFP